MKTIVADPTVETRLYHYADKVRPYLDDPFLKPDRSTGHIALYESRSKGSK